MMLLYGLCIVHSTNFKTDFQTDFTDAILCVPLMLTLHLYWGSHLCRTLDVYRTLFLMVHFHFVDILCSWWSVSIDYHLRPGKIFYLFTLVIGTCMCLKC